MDLLYAQSGKPLKDRETTVRVMKALTSGTTVPDDTAERAPPDGGLSASNLLAPRSPPRPPVSNVYGQDQPLILSDIPESCYTTTSSGAGIVVGIDEAGRGSVIGPMIYGMSFWHTTVQDKISKEFGDSKQLTEDQRERLYEIILSTKEMGFCTRVLHASEISRNMLRQPQPYNLNQMSHDAAIRMIQCLVDCKLNISTCYIDTVGNPESYKRRLEGEFPGMEFVVESKADDKYAPCSAASIVAKVVRDRMLKTWTFSEPAFENLSTKFGSGYPSDPVCKAWMRDNLSDPIFGFPDVVRFSWAPTKKQLAARGKAVTFAADDQEDDGEEDVENHKILLGKKRQQQAMSAFLSTGTTKPKKRLPYFERRRLQVVTKL